MGLWILDLRLAVLLVFCLLLGAAGVVFGPLSESTKIDPNTVTFAVLLCLVIILILVAIVSYKLVKLWLQKRRGTLGSKLQSRIVMMFAVVAIVPTIVISGFSAFFLNYSVQVWFNQKIRLTLEKSIRVAEIYLQEHNQRISSDAIGIANYLSLQPSVLKYNNELLQEIVQSQADLRNLTEVVVFRNDKVIASSRLSFISNVELIPWAEIEKINHGDIVVLTSPNNNRVRALIKIDGLIPTYLMVGKLIDDGMLKYVSVAQNTVDSYRHLKAKISSLQIQFSIIFLFISLLLLLASIWMGISFSSAIVLPVTHLFYATQRVQKGDFSTRVEEGNIGEEIATLARSFNKMTAQLDKQRKELTQVYKNINERRIFIEAVLSRISSGVIAITQHKYITLFNSSAKELLSLPNSAIDKLLDNVVPEISNLIDSDQSRAEILILRNHKSLTLLVKIDPLGQKTNGYIITFDDISKLVAAQRAAAWSDVARRIAHEIKNPITPIYLAAERLSKKYQNEITTDQESFKKYLHTITKHVTNISYIVDEFTNFARMPAPNFACCDICKIVRESAFSGQFSNKGVIYQVDAPEEPLLIVADESQISHVLINLLKNACESISMNFDEGGLVKINIIDDLNYVIVTIEDNGVGFPYELIDRLTEPYVTTRNKGTGLGLAIVKKIIDEHNAKISFINTGNGALVQISFIKHKD